MQLLKGVLDHALSHSTAGTYGVMAQKMENNLLISFRFGLRGVGKLLRGVSAIRERMDEDFREGS